MPYLRCKGGPFEELFIRPRGPTVMVAYEDMPGIRGLAEEPEHAAKRLAPKRDDLRQRHRSIRSFPRSRPHGSHKNSQCTWCYQRVLVRSPGSRPRRRPRRAGRETPGNRRAAGGRTVAQSPLPAVRKTAYGLRAEQSREPRVCLQRSRPRCASKCAASQRIELPNKYSISEHAYGITPVLPYHRSHAKIMPRFQGSCNDPGGNRRNGARTITDVPKLLDQVREAARRSHYSIRTEDAYVDWTKRFILFHRKRHPLEMGDAEVIAFLTHRRCSAMGRPRRRTRPRVRCSSSTRSCSEDCWRWLDHQVVRAKTSVNFDQLHIIVRDGKGRKDQATVLSASLIEPLRHQAHPLMPIWSAKRRRWRARHNMIPRSGGSPSRESAAHSRDMFHTSQRQRMAPAMKPV